MHELERRLAALETAQATPDDEQRRRLDALVHDAVELSESVRRRRIEALVADVEHLRAQLSDGLLAARQHTEAAIQVSEHKLARRIDLLRRSQEAVHPGAGAGGRAPASGAVEPQPAPAPIDDDLYLALEDRFRGAPEVVEERQRHYLPYLDGVVHSGRPVLDVGCGRGEWLAVLREAGIPAIGIDTNPVAVAECREAGLEAVEADVLGHLETLPDGSLGAITMFQVVEHLPFAVLVDTFRAAARVLGPGGLLVAETPNALNLRVAATTFWIDPTHQRPLHPEVLVFLALEAGFTSVERLFLNPIGPEPVDLSALSALDDPAAELLRRLASDVDGPGDFSLIARTPALPAP